MSSDYCRRLGPCLLVSLLLAQIVFSLHKADHSGTLQDTPCLLCLTADHLGGPLPAKISHGIAATKAAPIPFTGRRPIPVSFISPYESRAPPPAS